MTHKAGFVNIIGNPNVGKSTLMNLLIGEKLCITNPKAQTTRHRILGIVNDDDFQIVYSDTPGILKPNYKMQEGMMKFVNTALVDADIILFMTDIFEKKNAHEEILEKLKNTKTPIVLLINKIDLADQEKLETVVDHWKNTFPKSIVIPLSALEKFNIDSIQKQILTLLPEGEAYYPKDDLTDKSERFFISEIIREKILTTYQKEIPYSCEVIVTSFKEEKKITRIEAEIIVAKETQKGIIIGHKGSKLKRVGSTARKDIEAFLSKQVFLELFVKVNKDWRNNERQLKKYGYLH